MAVDALFDPVEAVNALVAHDLPEEAVLFLLDQQICVDKIPTVLFPAPGIPIRVTLFMFCSFLPPAFAAAGRCGGNAFFRSILPYLICNCNCGMPLRSKAGMVHCKGLKTKGKKRTGV